jgi:hypothetical protein
MAAVGALVLGVASFAMQAKSAKAQEKAMKAQQRAQELADARDRRKLLRQTAIARGETLNFGANLGAMGGTALAGGLSGLVNQQQAQLGFQQTTLDISKYITQQNIRSSQAMTTASMFSGLSDGLTSYFKSLPGSTVKSPYTSVFG